MGKDMEKVLIKIQMEFHRLEHEDPKKGLERWTVIGKKWPWTEDTITYYRAELGYWLQWDGKRVGPTVDPLMNEAREEWIAKNFKWERI